MNDYDDSDEYSSSASFRARSNTWPLNRPDLAVPGAGICIDETLPEIELEEDDLFTTNENWSTGLVDHDIMSWDPILNAQNQQVSAAAASATAAPQAASSSSSSSSSSTSSSNTNQQAAATVIHHHHQPNQQQQLQQPHHLQPQHNHHQQDQDGLRQRQQVGHMHTQQATSAAPKHHIQQLTHRHQQQQPPPPPPPQPSTALQQHPHHHHHHHQNQHQHHDSTIGRTLLGVEQTSAQVQQQQQPPPPHHQQHHHHHHQHQHQHHQVSHIHPQHQTLNSSLCLDADDPNEYHIQQLHHLRLDSNPHAPGGGDTQQGHYVSSLSPVCIQGSTANIGNDSYNNSSDHQQHNLNHHLQPLSSARYDLDQHENYDLKPQDDDLQLQTTSHLHHDQHHHHHHHLNHQHQQSHHQLHHLTSSSLDNQSSASHMLSSSLSTSGIGLSGDLEDLDYKGVDPSTILNPYDDLPQHLQDQQQADLQALQAGESLGSEPKQSNSTSASKSKLNTPRRNAWGNLSYADLISQAINSTSDKRLTLSQIYDWMVQHVPYFKDKGDSNSSAGWKNSVRHNLSLHSRFKRLQNEGTGKSSWWTINPEANVGKCARRRAASMEASKYEKKRGRAKKRAEAIRQGLVSYPSLTNSSLNGSTSTLEQQQAQSSNQFQNPDTQPQTQEPSQQQQQHVQPLDQFAGQQSAGGAAAAPSVAVAPQPQQQQPPPPTSSTQLQAQPQQQTLDQYGPDQPSQQQQAHLQQLQLLDGHNNTPDQSNNLHDQQQQPGLYMATSQTNSQYEEKNDNMLQQPHQHQQSQYYYQFEVSTAL